MEGCLLLPSLLFLPYLRTRFACFDSGGSVRRELGAWLVGWLFCSRCLSPFFDDDDDPWSLSLLNFIFEAGFWLSRDPTPKLTEARCSLPPPLPCRGRAGSSRTANNNASQTLSATDVLAPTTMKAAAKCETHCDLRNSVNQ